MRNAARADLARSLAEEDFPAFDRWTSPEEPRDRWSSYDERLLARWASYGTGGVEELPRQDGGVAGE